MSGVRVDDVRFEHRREALGIGEARPRVSWRVSTDAPGWDQAAYEVEVTSPGGEAETSGRVESGEMVLVPWPAAPLASRERRSVRVRVWGEGTSDSSDWSEAIPVEAGLLVRSDWKAVPIGPDRDLGDRPDRPPVLMRRAFELADEIASARLYVSAHGVYEAEINGQRVGDHVLAPGWTSYRHRLRYQTFDVSTLLARGANVLGATVAEGWYCGHLGFHGGKRRIWGEDVALIAQLEITHRDGRVETIATSGDGWRWANGPFVGAGIYAGEEYDARLEAAGWSAPGFDDSGWGPVRALEAETAVLVAPDGPPVRRIEEIAAISVTPGPSGGFIVDFGQDLVGRVRFQVSGERGATITLHHGEVLEDGRVATRPLRGAAAVDRYTLRGGGPEEWEPRFTFHGFRYVQVDGWPASPAPAPEAAGFTAIVLHTDMERTGWFETSEPLLNRLHENIVWTMRGNFLDIPTDCPQRDERLGWTGDLGVFAPTAAFLYDCSGLLRSWLSDVAAEAREFGTVPLYVPWLPLTFPNVPVAVWGDGGVVVPWLLYERFGDERLLGDLFPTMAAWVDRVEEVTGPSHLWTHGLQLGDWLDPAAPPDAPERAQTDPYLIATAYHALTAQIVADAAGVLGRDDDARRYGDLAAEIRDAFRREYVAPNGRVVSDAQTAYALALEFGLLDEAQSERAGRRLVDLVRASDHHVGTGFVGARLLCDALVHAGAADAAYHVLMRRDPPSWLYPVTMGATTIWERWDSMLPDGSLNPGDMLSFNHYALGAIGDWLHRTVAGLAAAEPGYRRILVAPLPGGGLEHASATHLTPYGGASVAWRRSAGRLDVDVVVPPGARAIVRLPEPGWIDREVGSGKHSFSCSFRRPQDDPPRPPAPSALGLPPEGGQFEA